MTNLFAFRSRRVQIATITSIVLACWEGSPVDARAADSSKEDAERARAALDLRIARDSADALVAQREAEARKAIADADRAEMLAHVPPYTARPLAGSVDTAHFGAAGLVRALDLALELAQEVCTALPAEQLVVVYEPVRRKASSPHAR